MRFFKRSSVDATALAIESLQTLAAGGVPDQKTPGVVLGAMGLIARSLTQCEVTTRSTDTVTARLLSDLGSECVLHGQALRLIDGGLWAVEDVTRGSVTSGDLAYKLRRRRPGQAQQYPLETVSADRVVDVQWPTSASNRSDTLRALSLVERVIAEQAASPHGQLLALANSSNSPSGSTAAIKMTRTLSRVMKANPGMLLPAPGGTTTGQLSTALSRIGLDPTQPLTNLRAALENTVCALLGVPQALLTGGVGGGGTRELYRIFTRVTLEPLAKLITEQLRKLDPTVVIDSAPLGGRDTVSMARTTKSLTDAGVSLAEALRYAGFPS